jgi:hypothetical protein
LASRLFVDVVTAIRGSADPKSRHHVNNDKPRSTFDHSQVITIGPTLTPGQCGVRRSIPSARGAEPADYLRRETRRAIRRGLRRAILRDPNMLILSA